LLPLFGTVEMLERTQGLARSIHINPLQASILLIFNEKDTISINELKQLFNVSEENIK